MDYWIDWCGHVHCVWNWLVFVENWFGMVLDGAKKQKWAKLIVVTVFVTLTWHHAGLLLRLILIETSKYIRGKKANFDSKFLVFLFLLSSHVLFYTLRVCRIWDSFQSMAFLRIGTLINRIDCIVSRFILFSLSLACPLRPSVCLSISVDVDVDVTVSVFLCKVTSAHKPMRLNYQAKPP